MTQRSDRFWIEVEGRTTLHGREPQGAEMRFHSDWWHTVFNTASGFEVVIGPSGIGLGKFPTMEAAKERAEDNARERALNGLASARQEVGRCELVLAALVPAKTGEQR